MHNRGPQRQKQRGHLLKTTPRPYFAISPERRERMTFNHKDGIEQGVGAGAERTEQPVAARGLGDQHQRRGAGPVGFYRCPWSSAPHRA